MIPRRSLALTTREKNGLALIEAFALIERRMPSLREIAKGLGLKEDTQAARIVQTLMRRELIGAAI